MALITCPECGKEVSSEAYSCPVCGFPLRKKEKTNTVGKFFGTVKEWIVRKKFVVLIIVLLIIALCVGAAVYNARLKCSVADCENNHIAGGKYCTQHTCAYQGCTKKRGANLQYCAEHLSSGQSAGTKSSSYSGTNTAFDATTISSSDEAQKALSKYLNSDDGEADLGNELKDDVGSYSVDLIDVASIEEGGGMLGEYVFTIKGSFWADDEYGNTLGKYNFDWCARVNEDGTVDIAVNGTTKKR